MTTKNETPDQKRSRIMKRARWIIEAATARDTPMYEGNRKVRDAVTDAGRERLEEVTFVTGYAEPGYGDEHSVIAFGDWNEVEDRKTKTTDKIMERVARLLEKAGTEVEWSDEWTTCEACQKAVRTQPDSYSWQPSYVQDDDYSGPVCEDCVLANQEAYLESLEGDASRAITINVDPEDHGYVRVQEDDFESGFHGGQDDDPKKIAKSLRARGVKRFLFKITETSQFYRKFMAYVREDEAKKVKKPLTREEVAGKDPAEGLKAGFADTSRAEREAVGEGPITIVNIDVSTGKASARKLTGEQFKEGVR